MPAIPKISYMTCGSTLFNLGPVPRRYHSLTLQQENGEVAGSHSAMQTFRSEDRGAGSVFLDTGTGTEFHEQAVRSQVTVLSKALARKGLRSGDAVMLVGSNTVRKCRPGERDRVRSEKDLTDKDRCSQIEMVTGLMLARELGLVRCSQPPGKSRVGS